MYNLRIFITQMLLMIAVVVTASDVTFKVNAPNTVAAGQQFRVEYVVNDDGRDFRAEEFVGLDVLMGPSTSSSMSTQIINGRTSSQTSKTFTFIVSAPAEGSFKIPGATVKVDGRQYTTSPRTIKVLPQGETAGTNGGGSNAAVGLGKDDILVRLILSKSNVYEGEGITATVKLMTLNSQIQVPNTSLPSFEGFAVQEVKLPENKSLELENYNGKNYYAVNVAQWVLFPQRTGEIKIDPVTFDLLVSVRSERRMRSIFDDFFEGYQQVNRRVKSSPVTVKVKALPAGKPSNFSGGVGQYDVKSSISATEIDANEALTYKIDLTGTGNIKFAKDPAVDFPEGFEVYDPQTDVNINASSAGVKGEKTIEYTIIPRVSGDFEIPAVQFSYFDVKTNKYITDSTESYTVKVARGQNSGDATGGVVSSYNTPMKEDLKVLGNDIRYLSVVNAKDLQKDKSFFLGSLTYWLSYIVSFLIFAIFFVVYRKQIKENANVAHVRNKKANKVATKRLKVAAACLKNHQREQYYEEILKAVWGYLADKLTISTSELTRDNVQTQLLDKGVDSALVDRFMNIISDCEFARYAPSQSDSAMGDLYDQTVKAIGDLENSIGK